MLYAKTQNNNKMVRDEKKDTRKGGRVEKVFGRAELGIDVKKGNIFQISERQLAITLPNKAYIFKIFPHNNQMNQGKCWNKQEDKLLKELYETKAVKKWSLIAQKINKTYQGSNKSGKQCRERYHNSLAPFIVKKDWTKEEEEELFRLHDELGNKWTHIATKLPGRAHNCVKNRFYAEIRKSLRKFNRWQKQLKIKEVKLVKVEGVIKILSLGYKNFDQEHQYKNLSDKCLGNLRVTPEIKHQLIYFHKQNPHTENFADKIIELYKSICELTIELRNYRISKNRPKTHKNGSHLKLEEFSSDNQLSELDFSSFIPPDQDLNEPSEQAYFKPEQKPKQRLPAKRPLPPKDQNGSNMFPLADVNEHHHPYQSFPEQAYSYGYPHYQVPSHHSQYHAPPAYHSYDYDYYHQMGYGTRYYMGNYSHYYTAERTTNSHQDKEVKEMKEVKKE